MLELSLKLLEIKLINFMLKSHNNSSSSSGSGYFKLKFLSTDSMTQNTKIK